MSLPCHDCCGLGYPVKCSKPHPTQEPSSLVIGYLRAALSKGHPWDTSLQDTLGAGEGLCGPVHLGSAAHCPCRGHSWGFRKGSDKSCRKGCCSAWLNPCFLDLFDHRTLYHGTAVITYPAPTPAIPASTFGSCFSGAQGPGARAGLSQHPATEPGESRCPRHNPQKAWPAMACGRW